LTTDLERGQSKRPAGPWFAPGRAAVHKKFKPGARRGVKSLARHRETGGPSILRVIASGAAARARTHLRGVPATIAVAAAVLAASLGGAAPARSESAPLVTTGSSSEVGLSTATLSGTIEGASALQGCWFEWGPPPLFEASAPCRLGSAEGGAVQASAVATGLQIGTSYGWRLAASNGAGVAHGFTESFTTNGFPLAEPPAATEQLAGGERLPPAPVGAAAHGHFEGGLYVAYCPPGTLASRRPPRAGPAMADHTGWPALQCLKMDKGTYGRAHTIVGLTDVHNFLLGGYGNDTIWAGNAGDVIWGDYQPSGQHTTERDWIHGGEGSDWIYSSHGHDQIWTGAGDDHVALVYGWGTVHCNGPGQKTLVMRLLARNRHWRLVGCRHITIVPYRA
jgi:hypothetical protein